MSIGFIFITAIATRRAYDSDLIVFRKMPHPRGWARVRQFPPITHQTLRVNPQRQRDAMLTPFAFRTGRVLVEHEHKIVLRVQGELLESSAQPSLA